MVASDKDGNLYELSFERETIDVLLDWDDPAWRQVSRQREPSYLVTCKTMQGDLVTPGADGKLIAHTTAGDVELTLVLITPSSPPTA